MCLHNNLDIFSGGDNVTVDVVVTSISSATLFCYQSMIWKWSRHYTGWTKRGITAYKSLKSFGIEFAFLACRIGTGLIKTCANFLKETYTVLPTSEIEFDSGFMIIFSRKQAFTPKVQSFSIFVSFRKPEKTRLTWLQPVCWQKSNAAASQRPPQKFLKSFSATRLWEAP